MYFRLDTRFSLPACLMKPEDNLHETLMSGAPADRADLTLPWPFTMRCDHDPDTHLADYYSSRHLMSARLVEAIRGAGVDNLELFPAVITHKATGKIIDDYLVVNVLGLVSAADLGASKGRPLAAGRYFEELVVDPGKARDLLIFRLAESPIEILVHEKLARVITDGGFVDVALEPAGQ
jgi:hypothetical protein